MEKFENGFFTLKTHEMSSALSTPRHLESLDRGMIRSSWRNHFRKVSLSKWNDFLAIEINLAFQIFFGGMRNGSKDECCYVKYPQQWDLATRQYINNQMCRSTPKIVTKTKYTSTDRLVSALPRRYYFAQIIHQSNNIFLSVEAFFWREKDIFKWIFKKVTFVMKTRPS